MNESYKKALEQVALSLGADSTKAVAEYEKAVTEQKALSEKAANEIMSGANAWYGAEARTTVVFKDELYAMVDREYNLLSFFPGNHGQIDNTDSVKVPMLGEVGVFKRWVEKSGSYTYISKQPTHALGTGQITITFQQLVATIAISKQTLKRYVGGEAQMNAHLLQEITRAFARTVESYVINGDSDGTTGNINALAVLALAEDHRYGSDGLRKIGISNGLTGASTAYSRGTLAQMYNALPNHNAKTDKLLWVFGSGMNGKVRFDPTYSTKEVYGEDATNKKGGPVMKPEGITSYQAEDMPTYVTAGGIVTGTASHVPWMLVYRPAVQFAYGADMEIVVFETATEFFFDIAGYFGFTVVNKVNTIGATVAHGLATA